MIAGAAIADELSLMRFAVAGPWLKPRIDPHTFGHSREPARGALVLGLAMIIVFETVPVHLAVASHLPKLAWWLTAGSVYALLWLMGDFQALRLGRSRVGGGVLDLRVGLRWRAQIPIASIAAVRTREVERLAAAKGVVNAAPKPATPRVLLELAEPVSVRGLYGMRRVASAIALAPDEREAFVTAMAEAGVRVDPS